MLEIIFSKKEFQMWDFESFIFWSKFRCFGYCFRTFQSVFFFFNSSSSTNHGGRHELLEAPMSDSIHFKVILISITNWYLCNSDAKMLDLFYKASRNLSYIFIKVNSQYPFSVFVLKSVRVIGLSPAFHTCYNPITQITDENGI